MKRTCNPIGSQRQQIYLGRLFGGGAEAPPVGPQEGDPFASGKAGAFQAEACGLRVATSLWASQMKRGLGRCKSSKQSGGFYADLNRHLLANAPSREAQWGPRRETPRVRRSRGPSGQGLRPCVGTWPPSLRKEVLRPKEQDDYCELRTSITDAPRRMHACMRIHGYHPLQSMAGCPEARPYKGFTLNKHSHSPLSFRAEREIPLGYTLSTSLLCHFERSEKSP
jgi:hypothetical protein